MLKAVYSIPDFALYLIFMSPCSFVGFCYNIKVFIIFVITGSAITGPVAKECADLWPRIASNAGSVA